MAPPHPLVVLEATGRYWIARAVALDQAGCAVAVVNPPHVHNYAKSLPRRSKTDARDAKVRVHLAIERQPRTWTPPPAVDHELRQRLVARAAVMEMRQQARNQRHALVQGPVQLTSVKAQRNAVNADLDNRIATWEHEIASVLREQAWTQAATLRQPSYSVGPLTTAWL
jgi:transposase